MRILSFSFIVLIELAAALRNNVGVQRSNHNLPSEIASDLVDRLGNVRRQTSSPKTILNYPDTEWFDLPLDHWNSSEPTFRNRYWVSDAFYKPDGPVFLLDAGEQDAAGLGEFFVEENWILMHLAREFSGMAILWEHRYYGESTPFPTKNTPRTAPLMKFLDTEQALADIPTFAWNFTRKNLPDQDLTPASTPWIFIGGSYPGMRAAFVRHAYPETIFASYASSAPVQASIDMSTYFEPIWQGMQAYGYRNCTMDIHAAILEMDDLMDDAEQSFALKEKFYGSGAGNNTNADFAAALTSVFGKWQDVGMGGDYGLGEFCDWISTDPETAKTSSAEGWAFVKGPQFTIDRWSKFLELGPLRAVACAGIDGADLFARGELEATRTSDKCTLGETVSHEPSTISWTWQYCSQWGFFQTANIGPHQLISKHLSLLKEQQTCHQQFPDGLSSGLLPLWPDVDSVNARYKGWDIRPSNTFWVAGEFDPWRTLTPLSDMWFSPKNKAVQTAPDCAKADADEDADIFGYVMKNSEHCPDFEWNKSIEEPRGLFINALTKWLKCFVPGKRSSNVKTNIRTVQY